MNFYYTQFFSFDEVEEFLEKGIAIDSIKGGFILGNAHEDEGIPVLRRYKDGYRLMAEFEGEEFLLNPASTKMFMKDFERLNNFERDEKLNFPKIENFENLRILDCRLKHNLYSSKFLLTDTRCEYAVFNKHSTKRYIKELDEMNKKYSGKLWGEPETYDPFNFLTTKPDFKFKG